MYIVTGGSNGSLSMKYTLGRKHRIEIVKGITCLLLLFCLINTPQAQVRDSFDLTKHEIFSRYDHDPSTLIDSRIRSTASTVLKLFQEAGMSPVEHTLTPSERNKVVSAIHALPPLHQVILKSHLRSINFLDSMPNTALTSTVNPEEKFKLFDITIRAAILNETVSEWLTNKEQTCFRRDSSDLNISVEAGTLDALLYILLHEATHVIDAILRITPSYQEESSSTAFTKDIWKSRNSPAVEFPDSGLLGIAFRPGGKPIPAKSANSLYTSLSKTPFLSLYGSCNWFEDLAEYVSIFHFTQKLKQPFRVLIRNQSQILYTYQPLKSKESKTRMKQMRQFYKN